MKQSKWNLRLAFLFLIANVAWAGTTPPSLVQFSFDEEIDLSSGPAEVLFSVEAVDDESGVHWGQAGTQMTLINPSGRWISFVFDGSGSTGSAAYAFAADAPEGTWRVHSVLLEDLAGNLESYQTSELQALGFPVALNVVNPHGDNFPPVLSSLSFDPQVDLSGASRALAVAIEVAEEGSGVVWGAPGTQIALRDPSGNWASYIDLFEGEGLAGHANFVLPADGPPGVWEVFSVILADGAGNWTSYNSADLAALGMPASIHVISNDAPGADLSIAVDPAQAASILGSDHRVELTVANNGPESALDVRIEMEVSAPAVIREPRLVGSGALACTILNGHMNCSLGDFSPGGSRALSILVEAPSIGDYQISANVTAANADPNIGNNGFLGSVSVQLDFDGDGIGDPVDTDDDNDELPDEQEVALGTNPYDRDTDNDGVDDGLEVQLGLDPLDPSDCPVEFCPESSVVLKLILMHKRG